MSEQNPEPEVLQVRRVEVVDGGGRVRAVLGELAGLSGPAPGSFGLELRDLDGRPRLWLALEPIGPSICFDVGGNIGVQIGISDAGGEVSGSAAFVVVADAAGTPRGGWRVEADGSVRTWP